MCSKFSGLLVLLSWYHTLRTTGLELGCPVQWPLPAHGHCVPTLHFHARNVSSAELDGNPCKTKTKQKLDFEDLHLERELKASSVWRAR